MLKSFLWYLEKIIIGYLVIVVLTWTIVYDIYIFASILVT